MHTAGQPQDMDSIVDLLDTRNFFVDNVVALVDAKHAIEKLDESAWTQVLHGARVIL